MKTSSFQAVRGCRSSIILLTGILSFFHSPLQARWDLLARFPATVNTSFFYDEERGLIGFDGVYGIYRTEDGGLTWHRTSTPSGYTGLITDIFMKDSVNGWATIDEYTNNSAKGLWSTTDGGLSWQANQALTGLFSGVYQTSSALIIADRYTNDNLFVSTDNGVTFTSPDTGYYIGINFTDDLHGVATAFNGTAIFTSDGGRSWARTTSLTVEAWGVYAEKGTPNFVVAGEKVLTSAGVPPENIYGSSDYGRTWQTIGSIPWSTTGHVAGVGQVIYAQFWTRTQDSTNPSGFIRSTDGGKTWIQIGGPSNYRDTRFSVVGCKGSVVYAFDEFGGVWKTTDGGNGDIAGTSQSPALSTGEIIFDSRSCANESATFLFSNISCNSMTFDSISFVDSTLPIISSGALSFTRYPKLPETLQSDSRDSLILQWDPKKLPPKVFQQVTNIRIHGSANTVAFDTVLAVGINSFALQPEIRPDSIVLSSNLIGQQICTTFVLKNSAPSNAAPFILESAALIGQSASFQIVSISPALPATIAGQDSMTLQVCFTPQDSLLRRDSLVLTTDCFSFGIALQGQGLSASGVKLAEAANSFSIHPNPAENEIAIHLTDDAAQKRDIEIFDALGKKVFSEAGTLLNSTNIITIDIRKFPPGVYMVRIGDQVQNFIKE